MIIHSNMAPPDPVAAASSHLDDSGVHVDENVNDKATSSHDDVAWIADVLAHQVLMFHPRQLQKWYNHHHNDRPPNKRPSKVDWDRFLDIVEQQQDTKTLAECPVDECVLLHVACATAAPLDVVECLVQASDATKGMACGLGLRATPLHLACYAPCSSHVVQLLMADSSDGDGGDNNHDENALIFVPDAYGRLPIHVACSRTGTADIVRLLLDADVRKRTVGAKDKFGATPLQNASNMSSGDVVALLLNAYVQADGMSSNEFGASDIPRQLPLHRAFRRSSDLPANMVNLMAKTPSAKSALTVKDRRGQIPMHVACHLGAGKDAFQELIDNDETGETFQAKDARNQTPSDLLIKRIQDGDETALKTLNDLAQADPTRRFFAIENDKNHTMLDELLRQFPEDLDRSSLSPVQRESLLLLIACTPPGSGTYSLSVGTASTLLGQRAMDQVFHDGRFHKTVNNLMCNRSFTFYFFLDFYVRVLLVVFYTISTNGALRHDTDIVQYFVLLYLCSIYLLIWQVKLAWYHQLYYLRELWNELDLVTNIMVIVSAALLQSGRPNEGSFRAFNVLVGGLVWFVVLSASLRSTFKHFSIFISAFSLILVYLIPFAISLFLMFGSFAEMYFKSTFGTPICDEGLDAIDFCSYDATLLKVYAMFVGGIDYSLLTTQTSTNLLVLTVFYGVIFTIVMLNVLVAVIFDAWSRVSPQGERIFWKYRHQFLIETTETKFLFVYRGFSKPALLDRFDDHFVTLLDRFERRPGLLGQAHTVEGRLEEIVFYVLEALYLLLVFVLGLVSAGLLWPRPFRRAVLSIGDKEEATDLSGDSGKPDKQQLKLLKRLTEQSAKLQETNDALVRSQEEVKEVRDTLREVHGVVLELSARVSEALKEINLNKMSLPGP